MTRGIQYTGYIDRLAGPLRRATRNLERAVELLDPHNPHYFILLQELAGTYGRQRRYSDQVRTYGRALTVVTRATRQPEFFRPGLHSNGGRASTPSLFKLLWPRWSQKFQASRRTWTTPTMPSCEQGPPPLLGADQRTTRAMAS